MDSKTCTMCEIGKHMNNFYKQNSKCKGCNHARGLKRYYKKKDKISNQQKISYEKNRDKIIIHQQNKRYIQIKDLIRSYVELENRLKTVEQKADSENNQNFWKLNLFVLICK